jgi:cellulose synthase/poly-beta-1,6-N-acetylglucosamine synthase-like glycosyltransferase
MVRRIEYRRITSPADSNDASRFPQSSEPIQPLRPISWRYWQASLGPPLHTALIILFWTSLAGLAFSYVGYPTLLYFASRYASGNRRAPTQTDDKDLPELTVLIAAHNAEQHVVDRINNILACDYPRDRLRIVVASDGSTDATVQRVEQFGQSNIRAIAFARRRGKAITLADAVRQVHSEVILFSDASTVFDSDSIRQLARHFADPRVGLATGKVAIVDAAGVPSESLYWRCEMMVRRVEAQLGIMLGASGAIYAIRRRVFVEPDRPVINDDLVLPMLAHLRHGCEFVFDETARAYALSSGGLAGEFRRRCRIGAGAFQCLPVLAELLHWRHARTAFAFASHKLLRWFCPFLLVAMMISNVALISLPGYRLFMTIQASAYLLAMAGLFAPQRGPIARVARVASSFLVMNLALLAGFFRWVFNPRNVLWDPTQRPTLDFTAVAEGPPVDVRIEQDDIAA